MVTVSLLIEEHEAIEQELIELEVIMDSETINYPNFQHVFKKLCAMWDEHEKKEESFFCELQKKGYGVPYDQILFAHGELGKCKNALLKALNSGSEFNLKEALENYGRKLISDLRAHKNMEDEILYRVPAELSSLAGN